MVNSVRTFLTGIFFTFLLSLPAHGVQIDFSGPLKVIEFNNGGVYSSAALDTIFSGFIDDVTAFGEISDGITRTEFTCCIDAGALSVTNNVILDVDFAALLNDLSGTMDYSDGQTIDLIDIEGDALTASNGRIEIGLSYVFDGGTFADEDLGNYPFDPNVPELTLFFITEEDPDGDDLYSGIGVVQTVPIPAGIWLMLSGFGLFSRLCVRRPATTSG